MPWCWVPSLPPRALPTANQVPRCRSLSCDIRGDASIPSTVFSACSKAVYSFEIVNLIIRDTRTDSKQSKDQTALKAGYQGTTSRKHDSTSGMSQPLLWAVQSSTWLVLADTCYTPLSGLRGRCCAVSGYSPGAIFSDAYNRSRPTPAFPGAEVRH